VLSTALPPSFLELAFGAVPFEQRPCRWDVGVIQADALGADGPATLAALAQLERELPAQLQREVDWIRRQGQPVLLLGDVPPAAAQLAQRLAAPLVWMGNFGWDAIYRPMGGAFIAEAERALECYRQGTALIRCPLALPMPWGLPTTAVGLTAGRPRHQPEQLWQRLSLPMPPERTVMVAFGGLGLSLDAALFARWPDHHFLVSDPGVAAAATNATLIPADLRPLELLPLCGRVITKPGSARPSARARASIWCGARALRRRRCWRRSCSGAAGIACSSVSSWRRGTGCWISRCWLPPARRSRPMVRSRRRGCCSAWPWRGWRCMPIEAGQAMLC